MIKFDVLVDTSELDRRVKLLVPGHRDALSKAINWTIYNARDAVRDDMSRIFDKPTPFTLNRSSLVSQARPESLEATWKIRDDQSTGIAPVDYLSPNIDGGRRKVKRFERALQAAGAMPKGWIAIPGPGAKLDAYGNMSRGQIVQILSVMRASEQVSGFRANQTERSRARNKKPRDYFVSMPGLTSPRGYRGRLPYGLYQRVSRSKIVTVLKYRDSHHYKRRFDPVGVGQRVVEKDFARLYSKAFQQVPGVRT